MKSRLDRSTPSEVMTRTDGTRLADALHQAFCAAQIHVHVAAATEVERCLHLVAVVYQEIRTAAGGAAIGEAARSVRARHDAHKGRQASCHR